MAVPPHVHAVRVHPSGRYTEESLLVTRGLGLQVSRTSWIGGCSSRKGRFIPTSRVRGLWIHEGSDFILWSCGVALMIWVGAVAGEGTGADVVGD